MIKFKIENIEPKWYFNLEFNICYNFFFCSNKGDYIYIFWLGLSYVEIIITLNWRKEKYIREGAKGWYVLIWTQWKAIEKMTA